MDYLSMLNEWLSGKQALVDYAIQENEQASRELKDKVDNSKFTPHMLESLIHIMVISDNNANIEKLKLAFKEEYAKRMHYEQYLKRYSSNPEYQSIKMDGGLLFTKK